MKYLLSVDLGGTNIQVALAEKGGKIFKLQKFPTRAAEGRDNVWRNLLAGLEEVLGQGMISRDKLAGIGVCAAGFFDFYSRTMISSPNLPGWEGFPLEEKLKEKLNLPVLVENDANAAAYGEFVFGAGKGKRNMVNITLGTGIGGGIIIEGEIYRGSGGFAGEIGHLPVLFEAALRLRAARVPGKPCFGERHCPRRPCPHRQGHRTTLQKIMDEDEELTAYHVFEAAKDGDAEAARIVENAACYLGRALAAVVNLLNPG